MSHLETWKLFVDTLIIGGLKDILVESQGWSSEEMNFILNAKISGNGEINHKINDILSDEK